ncbi:MAG: 2-hydroxychromene-2-carboxylate isomerase [Caulobacterales bacterium]|nr:2-hydroxychromene-2-carboxylate isomerase [Caulobacterales bacterium]
MADPRTIDVFFDFSSSYSYLALPDFARLEAAAPVRWRPFSLGAIYKSLGAAPAPADQPKGAYMLRDIERVARREGRSFRWPTPFPFNSIPAARAFYAVERDAGGEAAKAIALALFTASFGEGRDCSDPDTLSAVIAATGADAPRVMAATGEDAIKARLKAVTEEAAAAGVFGAPCFVVEGELFWGRDRLDDALRWAVAGPW